MMGLDCKEVTRQLASDEPPVIAEAGYCSPCTCFCAISAGAIRPSWRSSVRRPETSGHDRETMKHSAAFGTGFLCGIPDSLW